MYDGDDLIIKTKDGYSFLLVSYNELGADGKWKHVAFIGTPPWCDLTFRIRIDAMEIVPTRDELFLIEKHPNLFCIWMYRYWYFEYSIRFRALLLPLPCELALKVAEYAQ